MAKAKKPAHRPLKYGEENKKIQFWVPLSKVDKVRKLVYDYLKQFKK